MDGLEKLKNYFKNGKNKNIGTLIILILIGVLLLIASTAFKGTGTSTTLAQTSKSNNSQSQAQDITSDQITTYERQLENNLQRTLENIQGVGKVDVMIYFEGGEELVPAVNDNGSTSDIEEKDNSGGTRSTNQKTNGSTVVITTEGDVSKPLILKTYEPRITGVCVVAEGANDDIISLKLTQAVVNLFNLPINKVNVYPMKK